MSITIELLAACQRNDRRAQRTLYEACFNTLIRVCYRYAHNRPDAIDWLNLSFVKIIQKLDKYDAAYPFEVWARKVTVNTIIDGYRKRKTEDVLMDPDDLSYVQDTTVAHDPITNFDDAEYIMEKVQCLTPKQRLVFNLFAVEGYTHEEIAQQLNITEGVSRVHLTQARTRLREMLGAPKKETNLKKTAV